MQAANDNLDGCVSGFDEWETLHEVARKVVADCARKRAASHQVQGGPVYDPTGRATEDHEALGRARVGSADLRLVR